MKLDPNPYSVGQVLYRLVDVVQAHGDSGPDGDNDVRITHHTIHVYYEEWTVEKLTPHGAWVRHGLVSDLLRGARTWIRSTSTRLSPTKERAKQIAVRRREWHVHMCEERAQMARRRLAALLEDVAVYL